MKTILSILLLLFSMTLFSQNWTPEQQEILKFVKHGWSTWEQAVAKKDYSIHNNATNRPDEFRFWFTADSYLWTVEDSKNNFLFLVKDIKTFKTIAIKPLDIQVYDDLAFIWFYVSTSIENTKGITTTTEEKRFEVYRKLNGEWSLVAGMADKGTVDNMIE